VRGLRVKQRRPNIWIIDDLETPDTISNPKRMRRQADHIERDIMGTMVGKYRRLLYANNKFARVMTQTILQERHPKWTVHQIKAYNKVTYEPVWKSMYSPEFYQQQEEDMGIPAAYAEYNHETKLEGKNFNEEQIQWCKIPDWHEYGTSISLYSRTMFCTLIIRFNKFSLLYAIILLYFSLGNHCTVTSANILFAPLHTLQTIQSGSLKYVSLVLSTKPPRSLQ
jgi:hypothetical protein